MSTSEIKEIYRHSRSFVNEASVLIRKRFEQGFKTQEKADSSLVTEVDLEVEALLRDRISKAYPQHGILGEEGSPHNPGASHIWVLDPIDGTQSFVHGVPTFGCIIAVLREGQAVVGLIDHPMLNELYSAAKGSGTFRNDKPVKIRDSASASIDQNEIINICSKRQWNLSNQGDFFDSLWERHGYFRLYYDCFGQTRTIAGQCGASIEMNVKLWDIAPCKLLVEEAGGLYFDLGKRTLGSGQEVYSAVFGKPSVSKIVKNWIDE